MPETFLKRLPFFGGVAEEWLSQLASSAEETVLKRTACASRPAAACASTATGATGATAS